MGTVNLPLCPSFGFCLPKSSNESSLRAINLTSFRVVMLSDSLWRPWDVETLAQILPPKKHLPYWRRPYSPHDFVFPSHCFTVVYPEGCLEKSFCWGLWIKTSLWAFNKGREGWIPLGLSCMQYPHPPMFSLSWLYLRWVENTVIWPDLQHAGLPDLRLQFKHCWH